MEHAEAFITEQAGVHGSQTVIGGDPSGDIEEEPQSTSKQSVKYDKSSTNTVHVGLTG